MTDLIEEDEVLFPMEEIEDASCIGCEFNREFVGCSKLIFCYMREAVIFTTNIQTYELMRGS